MLHTETVSLGTLELLKSLMQDERMAQFVLVGGTSLSLQLGHRISKAITYWDDINFSEPIRMLDASTFRWQKIEKRLREMQRFPSKKIT